ncbi:transcriptional repressor LexA [Deinococcus koreensis]|uniref:Repressor LexA n=1 Tax=Deinococcus koreensis TaxID=2054903 RepID=A0A2K3USB2_9DEIO|nr:transcriptional repressor LexA [Deinococcus koreensis]PNY79397.1 repressor LexA [Deinococcus koreensis]
MPPRLTALRLNLLRTIARLIQGGAPPTAAELARLLGLTEATISTHLAALTALGLIHRPGARGRLQLTDEAHALLETGIPIYGQIAAGPPTLAEQAPDRRTPSLDALLGVQEGDYLLEVRGESMTGIGLMDGDLVLVRPASDVMDGEIAVVLLPDENTATLKRLYRLLDEIVLESENPAMARLSFPADQVVVQGRMIGRLGVGAPKRSSRRR